MHTTLQKLLCCIAFCIVSGVLPAQRVDSLMKLYHDDVQTERVHLHFDKTIYNPAETIWYKVYLFSGIMPSDISTNIYMDWYDTEGKLLQHISAPVIGSTASSHFDVPANYRGRAVEVKVYTTWMLNADPDFIFDKYIRIAQPIGTAANQSEIKTTLNFFPEGGDLVAGLSSKLAFMATRAGLPVSVKGIIKNEKGELVDSFATEHDGMGSLMIEPLENEKYTVTWIDSDNNTGTAQIPSPKKTGIVMQVRPLSSREVIVIKRTADAPDNLKTLHLVAHMHEEPVFTATVNMQSLTSFTGQIPILSLPTGVLQITIFDANWLPVAERVVFVKGDEYTFETQVTLPVKNLARRGKNEMEISVADSIFSDLSVSVTESSVSAGSDNIFSQLLLSSDIKGYIHNPMYYFAEDNDSAAAHLDLVMQTHGWRRFRWDAITKAKKPELLYPLNGSFISITGKISNQAPLKIPVAEPVVGLVQNRRDSGQQIFTLLLEKNGSFSQAGMSFYDTVKFLYRFPRNDRFTEKATVDLRTNLLTAPAVFSSRPLNPFVLQDSTALPQSIFFAAEQNKMYAAIKAHQLPGVTVNKRVRKNVDILDDLYVSPRFKEDGIQFDVEHDPRGTLPGMSLYQFLEGRIPGMRIVYDSGMVPYPKWRLQRTDIYLDEIAQEYTNAASIQMRDIAYIKVLRPGTSVGGSTTHFGGSPGGLIALYSKRGVNIDTTSTFRTQLLVGYTAFKDFYSPDYSQGGQDDIPDARTTLYWNPSIKLDASQRTVRLPFYNNDYTKKIRIVLEGMNAEGKLTRVEKIIE